MKRFLSIFICLALLLSMSIIFASCDNADEPAATTTAATTTEATTEDSTPASSKASTTAATTTATSLAAPAGSKLYSDGIVFAYPEEWTVTSSGAMTQIVAPNGQSNLVVTWETATNAYDTLSAAEFEAAMQPTYSALGMSMSNVTVRTETSNGLSVRVFKFNTTVIAQSATMTQTLFVVTVGDRTYSVALSENTPDETVTDTILATLRAA